MDLDDLFDNDHNKQKHNNDHNYRHDEHHTSYQRKNGFDGMPQIIERITANPKLVRIIGLTVILIAIVLIVLIIVLFPAILELLKFLTDNGLKGLLDLIWSGAK